MNLDGFIHAIDGVDFARRRLGFDPDAKQSLVLAKRVRRGLLNCSRQWGKSTVAAVKAVHQAETKAGCLVVVLSPSARQSGELIRKASEFVQRMGIQPRGDGDNERSLLFPNGSRIVGLPGKEGTVRGFSAVSLILIDEAARVRDDLYKAVRPMLAVGGGDLWLMSTPAGKRGFFYEAWTNGGEKWERVAVTGAENGRIDADFLEEERAEQDDQWFRQEYCCEFTDAEESLFDSDHLDLSGQRPNCPSEKVYSSTSNDDRGDPHAIIADLAWNHKHNRTWTTVRLEAKAQCEDLCDVRLAHHERISNPPYRHESARTGTRTPSAPSPSCWRSRGKPSSTAVAISLAASRRRWKSSTRGSPSSSRRTPYRA